MMGLDLDIENDTKHGGKEVSIGARNGRLQDFAVTSALRAI
jgi:hypothetical protein